MTTVGTIEEAITIYKSVPTPADPDTEIAADWENYDNRLECALHGIGWERETFWDEYPRHPQYLKDLTDEYVAKQGSVTCEVSTSAGRLAENEDLLRELNALLAPIGARWVSWECDTCAGHSNGSAPLHLAIETYGFIAYDPSHAFDQEPS